MENRRIKLRPIEKNSVLIVCSFLLSAIVAIIILGFDEIYYSMADDYLMHLISKGVFGNGADAYLVFINIILGYILKGLNILLPSLDWFILFYIFAIIYCFTLLIFIFYKETKNLFFVAGLVLIESVIIYHLTFTIVAYLCIATAFLYWADLIISDSAKISVLNIIIISSCFCLGIMYRKGVYLSTICLFIPFIIFYIKRILTKAHLIVVVWLFFLFTITSFVNDQAYHNSEQWEEYSEFNKNRAQVVDNIVVNYAENQEKLQEIGLSENDLKCVYQWIFADKEVFSADRMQKLAEINPAQTRLNFDFVDILKKMIGLNYNYYFLFVIVLALYFSGLKKSPYILATSFLVYGEIAALYIRNRPVERIMIPIYIIGSLLLFIGGKNYKGVKSRKSFPVVGTLFALMLMFAQVNMIIDNNKLTEEYEARNNKYKEVYEYINQHHEWLFAGSSSTLNGLLYNDNVLGIGTQMSVENVIKLGSWDIYSSRYYYQTKKYNIEDPDRLILGMADNENVVYIVNSDNTYEKNSLKQFFLEHEDGDTEFELVKKFENVGIEIYRLETQ